MAQGIPTFRRSQSRWIARQLQQYRSVARTPETWRVLFAAFEARYPHGGRDGAPISFRAYKNHVSYVQRKIKEEEISADAAARAEAHLLEHEQRMHEQRRLRSAKRAHDAMKHEAPSPRTKDKPKLLRTRRTAAAFAAAEDARQAMDHATSTSCATSERRSTKRLRTGYGQDDDHVVIKQEGGLSQVEMDRDRLATELRECQASLKRMKQSAHAWKVKYEELLQATQPRSPTPTMAVGGDPGGISFTMNINVDVSQNGTHVRTDHHAMRLQGLRPVDTTRSRRR